jgi:DNA-binding beta-propeller fold protein YncE
MESPVMRMLKGIALLLVPAALGAQSIIIAGNKPANTVTLVDLASGNTLATLPTGLGPHEAAASRDGKWAVITDYGTGPQPGSSLTLVDVNARTVAAKIDIKPYRRPHGVQFLPGDSMLAVSVEADSAVLLVHIPSRSVRKVVRTNQGTSHMVSVRADGKFGYTANIGSASVTELNFETGAARSLTVARQPEGVGVRPDGKEVWAASNTDGVISVVDIASWSVATNLPVGERAYRISFTPDGKYALASLTASSRVRIYDAATRVEIATITIAGTSSGTDLAPTGGAQPVGIAYSSDSKFAYVACQGINAVAIVDIIGRKLVKTIPVGPGPDAVAIAERR